MRRQAAYVLQAIGLGDAQTIHALVNAFQQDLDKDVRVATLESLAFNSQGEAETIQLLTTTIVGPEDTSIRAVSAFALGKIVQNHPGAFGRDVLNQLAPVLQSPNEEPQVTIRVLEIINNLNYADQQAIDIVLPVLQQKDDKVLAQAAITLANIAQGIYEQSNTFSETNENQKIVRNIQENLSKLKPSQNSEIFKAQTSVSHVLEEFDRKRQDLTFDVLRSWLIGNRAIWILHPLVWLGLIWAYPKSRQIQAFFFWNKHIRAVLGCWYVGPLITAVPFLRCRLFAPFKDSLLADAKLDIFDPQAYFPDSEVQLKGTHQTQPLAKALPEIKGEIILEGESGLGKTMLLRHLVKQTKRVTVYLPAYKCEKGVIEAIQAKLHGQAQDAEFLRHLIYSGALDICIDGLNEVGADVRANITAFVESYFKGNILITTQPLLWNPPSTAKTYVLQPLPRSRIDRFLSLQQQRLSTNQAQSPEYEAACATFLETALDEQQPAEDLALAQRILSNPMDLSVAAQIIHAGLNPDLFQLQQQQYTLMAKDYEQSWNQKFPLNTFSDYVYEMRVNDQQGMTGDAFYQALSIMEQEQHRMVLSRQWQDLSGAAHKEWSFRHDKIMEFFLVQPFLALDAKGLEKRKQHLGDSRFRGIYLLLARLLPLEAALALREDLIHYAADTKDHTVSDDYVQIMRSRTTETSSLDLA